MRQGLVTVSPESQEELININIQKKRGATEAFQILPWGYIDKSNHLWRQLEAAEDSKLTYLNLMHNSIRQIRIECENMFSLNTLLMVLEIFQGFCGLKKYKGDGGITESAQLQSAQAIRVSLATENRMQRSQGEAKGGGTEEYKGSQRKKMDHHGWHHKENGRKEVRISEIPSQTEQRTERHC